MTTKTVAAIFGAKGYGCENGFRTETRKHDSLKYNKLNQILHNISKWIDKDYNLT